MMDEWGMILIIFIAVVIVAYLSITEIQTQLNFCKAVDEYNITPNITAEESCWKNATMQNCLAEQCRYFKDKPDCGGYVVC